MTMESIWLEADICETVPRCIVLHIHLSNITNIYLEDHLALSKAQMVALGGGAQSTISWAWEWEWG